MVIFVLFFSAAQNRELSTKIAAQMMLKMANSNNSMTKNA